MDQLDVHPRIVAALRKSKLRDYGTILSLSGPDIQRMTQLSAADVTALHQAVALVILKTPVLTALQLYKGDCADELKVRHLTTGCSVLDAFLRGGILCQGITEISGESASGKTQWCIQLSLNAQLPRELGGLQAGVAYICTEDVFPNRRLMQMSQHFISHYKRRGINNLRPTDNIFIEHAAEMTDLQNCIFRKIPLLLSQGRVGLVIVDSIAALFRCEYSANNLLSRAKQISAIGGQLHKLSGKFNVPIICVNQVSAVMDKSSLVADSRKVTPALGISWANLVTTRLLLTRTRHQVDCTSADGRPLSGVVRTVEAMFSPHLPNSVCHYVVTEEGVKGLT